LRTPNEKRFLVKLILEKRVVPVIVLENVADAVPVAEALVRGGLPILEVTFRTPAAADCIRAIRAAFPEVALGAGTLLEPAQVKQAHEAGAQFGLAPGINASVVRASLDLGMPFYPGVMTPSDVELGLSLGCRLQKFFPADVAGGVKMLNALAGPYGHTGVKFIPLGGVNAGNAAEFLRLPNVAAIGGSWIADKKLIAAKDWAAITHNARAAVALAGAK